MKVFLSMRFRGRTEKEVLKRRNEVKEILEDMWDIDIDMLDNYHYSFDENKPNFRPVFMMAESELVVFDFGWDEVEGCRIEQKICEKWHLSHMYLSDLYH